jgi:hypothetical protein
LGLPVRQDPGVPWWAYDRNVGYREERVAKNEATSRVINEGMEAAYESDPKDAFVFFICECGLEQCDEP